MENQKDNIKDTQVPAVLDNREARYLVLKNEKLTQAVYMVTAFLGDNEPLKWKLRDRALAAMTELSVVKDTSVFYKIAALQRVTVLFDEIISMLGIALSGNSVSEMNFRVLKSEYENLKNSIETNLKGEGFRHYLIPPSFEREITAPNETTPSTPAPTGTSRQDSESKPAIPAIKPLVPKAAKPENRPYYSHDKTEKNNRRSGILVYLRGRDWVSISDIAASVSGCSTKTVQRELSELVEAGTIKKKGDRRWSRYMLTV